MSEKKSFSESPNRGLAILEGNYFSPDSIVSLVRRVAANDVSGMDAIRVHIHVAGPSARGKSYMAMQIARILRVFLESEGDDSGIAVCSLDRYGEKKDGKWVVDAKRAVTAIDDYCKQAEKPINYLITEGTSDNEEEVVSEIVTQLYIIRTVCCVVEPTVQSWLSMNLAKAAQAKRSGDVPISWIQHWEKIAKLSYSKAVEQLYSGTKQSVEFWSKLPFVTCVIQNYFIGSPAFGWHQTKDEDSDLFIQ